MKRIIRRIIPVVLFIVGTCALAFLCILILSQFRISTIKLSGVTSIKGVELLSRSYLFSLNASKVEKHLMRVNPSIKSMYISKEYPNTLYISAVAAKPAAQLAVSEGWYTLSPTARIIAKKRDLQKNMPVIEYFTKYPFETYTVGDVLESREIGHAVYLLDRVKTIKDFKVDQVAITHLFVIVFKSGRQEVWFTTKKSKEGQFDTLKIITRQLRAQGRKFERIDLRFSKPLVTLQTNN